MQLASACTDKMNIEIIIILYIIKNQPAHFFTTVIKNATSFIIIDCELLPNKWIEETT